MSGIMDTGSVTRLQPMTVESVEFEVGIDLDGKFSAAFQGDTYESETLRGLRYMLKDAIIAHRIEVPFVSDSGRHGTMRGYHAGNHDILVTWANGEKGRLSQHVQVFRPMDVDEERIGRIQLAVEKLADADALLRELRKPTVRASEMFSEAFGSDITRGFMARHEQEEREADTQN